MICLFPRIIPAPQALLKGTRPLRMPEATAKMTGVYSGVHLDTVGFFANIMHPLDEFNPFTFKVLSIKHKDRSTAGDIEFPKSIANGKQLNKIMSSGGTTKINSSEPHSPPHGGEEAGATGVTSCIDVESGVPQQSIYRRPTMKDKVAGFVAHPTLANDGKRPAIPARLYSPVHIISIFSVLLTAGIIIMAAVLHDGTAILAVSLVSLASSVVGLASWWSPLLINRSHTSKVPESNVVIRTREGAFLLIKCTEEVARELYSGTEECEYRVGNRTYRTLMGLGTFLLMVSVILLGNCTWFSQVFIGASYITLNGLYWAMGLLPKRYFWDLSRYDCVDETPSDSKADQSTTTDLNDPREDTKSFTRTLWWVIRETRRTAWVERSGAAPSTPQWKAWLAEAEQAARAEKRSWPAVARKDEIMNMTETELKKAKHAASKELKRA